VLNLLIRWKREVWQSICACRYRNRPAVRRVLLVHMQLILADAAI
jgi:hypothetical protein